MREEESLLTTELDRLSGYQGNILQLNLDLLLHKQRAVREEEWSPVHSTPLHSTSFILRTLTLSHRSLLDASYIANVTNVLMQMICNPFGRVLSVLKDSVWRVGPF